MKVLLLLVGKTKSDWIGAGVDQYEKKLRHYTQLQIEILPDAKRAKGWRPEEFKKHEAAQLMRKIEVADFVVLLDERGRSWRSVELAAWLEKRNVQSAQRLVFIIGGAFGFDKSIYERANLKLSLSRMTFTHEMARVLLLEQLYRGFSILANEPYHNEG